MRPGLSARLRWQGFRLLDRVARGGSIAAPPLALNGGAQEAVWLFISTIGELNATEPLLRALATQTGGLRWVILTDRRIYREAYAARFPDADIVEIGDGLDEAATLARLRPPRLFLITEIPVLPADAPCRLSYAWLHEAGRHGAPIALVNGWRYGYAPSCRSDAVERQLLGRDWLSRFSLLGVQNEQVAQALREHGAPASKIVVTGNMKFDALDRRDWQPSQARSPALLAQLVDGARPTVVAGCVTDADEQALILDAFVTLRQRRPDARLVIAPRHPENPDVMRNLAAACAARALHAQLRSTLGDAPLSESVDCLVLDTMGELKDFYAAAAVAHVGRNHNILEPLAFSRPVTVCEGWEPTYPSYPVYAGLAEAGALDEVRDGADLAGAWQRRLESAPAGHADHVRAALERARGATARTLAALQPLLQSALRG
ncbi:glycosyltransferase N-terminal domain-containing protein [Niveibacterium sp. SC-1]|uniref:3-deoxy-D-manno-octulosonic acid transferase n=1 Tax=Niveibacterium sp. SC-1 TaxID=3135646 RepID=UPI00311EEDA4